MNRVLDSYIISMDTVVLVSGMNLHAKNWWSLQPFRLPPVLTSEQFHALAEVSPEIDRRVVRRSR
jgi:hypothetical protein